MKKLLFKNFLLVFVFFFYQAANAQCGPVSLPFYESFQGITANDQLPPCWAASDLGNACKTFTNGNAMTGNACAGFFSGLAGSNYFYSQALSLHAGVTYSASVWKKSSLQNSTNWHFSLMLGTSQSTTGLSNITLSAAVTSTLYSSTSNTFNVNSSGTYYLVVMANSAVSGGVEYLFWDDLIVTAPCPYPGNSPSVTISPSSTSLCSGNSSITFTASGADTFTWSDGTQGPTTTFTPMVNTSFFVTGTSTLSNCSSISTITVPVYPSPILISIPPQKTICKGNTLQLSVTGATNVIWSTGATTSVITVSPSANTTYTVTGTNQYGCSSMLVIPVTVNPLPTINIHPSSATVCAGSDIIISAGGGAAYQWFNAPGSGAQASFTPTASMTYTVSGSDMNSCLSSTVGYIVVSECTEIPEIHSGDSFAIFPNPCRNSLTVSGKTKTIVIYDLTGKEITRKEGSLNKHIDVSTLRPGLYIVTIDQKSIRLIKE